MCFRLLDRSSTFYTLVILGIPNFYWLMKAICNLTRFLVTLLYVLRPNWYVKVRCPDCKGVAELADDFSFVKCSNCHFDMSYGEYVKYIAYRDSRYSDILSDYK
jgi:hypothetical protein